MAAAAAVALEDMEEDPHLNVDFHYVLLRFIWSYYTCSITHDHAVIIKLPYESFFETFVIKSKFKVESLILLIVFHIETYIECLCDLCMFV